MLKVALIGCGGISGAHVPAWVKLDGAELVAVCDIRREQAERWLDEKSDLHIYESYEDMMENETPDILDICLPTYLHAKYAIDAMDRGINVLCEKPIALTAEDAERVYAAAERNGVKFMVAQVLRFWGEYTYLKDLIDSGKYGKLQSARMSRTGTYPRTSWNDWMIDEKLSRLVPFDLHIHDLDFLVYALGEPKKANVFRSRDGLQDIVHYVYEYDDVFVSADAAWYREDVPFKAGYCFVFEHATAVYEGSLTVYTDKGETITPSFSGELEEGTVLGLPSSDGYFNEIKYFLDCVTSDKPIETVTKESILHVLHLLDKN